MSDRPYIFISYSHLEYDWVMSQVVEPLSRCRRKQDLQRATMFLDKDREGLRAGLHWRAKVFQAAKTCEKFVAICSEPYAASDECQYEFQIAFGRDPMGRKGIVLPVMRDRCPPPAYAENTQYISVLDQADWFERLCDSLELVPEQERLVLHFVTQPSDVCINETLAPLRIQVCNEAGVVWPSDDVITLRAERHSLQGETSRPAQGGIVEFDDLALDKRAPKQRLIASGEGMTPVFSQPFRVRQPRPSPLQSTDDTLPVSGQPVFFAKGTAIAVLGDRVVGVYSVADRSPLLAEPLQLNGRLRLVAQGRDSLVLADWEGYLHLLHPNTPPQMWKLCDESRSLNIIGAVAHEGDDVYVGMWSGEVFRIAGKQPPQLHLQHAAGVQALAVMGNRLAIAGLDGNLVLYVEGRATRSVQLEPIIRLVKPFGGNLAVVGGTRLYQIPCDGGAALTEESQLSDISAVYGDTRLPIVIDRQGRGIFINGELATCGEFRTTPGAIPVSADDAGVWCVFRNPNGVHTLLAKTPGSRQGKIVRSWENPIAINATGNILAVAESEGIRLLKPTDFCRDNTT